MTIEAVNIEAMITAAALGDAKGVAEHKEWLEYLFNTMNLMHSIIYVLPLGFDKLCLLWVISVIRNCPIFDLFNGFIDHEKWH